MSMKILDYNGLATLSAFIKQIKKTSEGNTSDVSELRDDLQELASQIAAVFSEVGDCIETLDSEKAYIAVRKEFSLATSDWKKESSGDFAYVYTLALSGISAETRADAVLDNASTELAGICGMAPTTETITDGVIFRSRTVPESAISGQLYITQGGTALQSAEET